MATDITGLLTGIPRGGIDPMVSLSPDQQRMAMGARAASGLKSGIRGMLGGGQPTAQQQISIAASQLDLSNPQDLTKVAKLQQISGDSAGAAKTLSQVQKQKRITDRKKALLKVAREQGNELVEEYILQAGDTESALNKVQEVLFRTPRGDKASSAPTKADMKLYKKLLEQYTDKDFERLGIETEFSLLGLGGGISEEDELIIINNAKEIFTNRPELGKKGALDEAVRLYGISQANEGLPTDEGVMESSSRMTGATIK